MRQKVVAVIAVLCVFASVQAGTDDPNEQFNLFEMSLSELMEVPVIVSSSRQAQTLNYSSAPISIVTAEDIHYSGLTTIPDILQFVPGVDVVKTNRHLYGVGIHGLHESISNHVVSLIDGRSANNPLFGGAEFNRLPIFLEDIERIEVVRGPGGAAWGANAFTGVINIITKDPEDTQGFFGSTTVTEFGDTFTHFRFGGKTDEWAWRFSAGYEDMVDSDDAGAGRYTTLYPELNPFTGFNSYAARDFARTSKFDLKAVYRPAEDVKVTLGGGYANMETGSYSMAGYYPMDENNRSEMLRLFTKIERDFDDGSSGHLQWFGNLIRMSYANVGSYDIIENDIEAQYNFAPMANHHLSIGGNFRWDDSTLDGVQSATGEYYIYDDAPYFERWAGLFLIDRWETTDRLTLEAQMRTDWYSEISTDWSNRFSAFYDLDGTDNHILRLSTARAFRNPLVSLRDLQSRTIYVPGQILPGPIVIPEFYALNSYSPAELKDEETWSFEAGYSSRLTDKLVLNLNTFYQRMSHLIGYTMVTPSPSPLGTHTMPANIDGADSYGGEAELVYEDKQKKLSAWYAYEHFALDQPNQSIRAFLPPTFKVGLTGRWFLEDGWVFNANYRFNDETPRNPARSSELADIDRFHLLDLAVSKTIAGGNGELMFGVSDLFNKTCDPVFETTMGANHTTPGRMFFARVQLHF